MCNFAESYSSILQDEVQSVSMDIGCEHRHKLLHARESRNEMVQAREAGNNRQSMKEWLKSSNFNV